MDLSKHAFGFSRSRNSIRLIFVPVLICMLGCATDNPYLDNNYDPNINSGSGKQTPTGAPQHDRSQPIPSLPVPGPLKTLPLHPSEGAAASPDGSDEFLKDNSIYNDIAGAITFSGPLSTEYLLQGSRYRRAAFLQSYFPQITPGASVDEDGNSIARLRVEQVIWDGGRLRSGRHSLGAEEATVFIQHAINFNDRVSRAVGAYLAYHKSRDLAAISRDILERYEYFGKIASDRLEEGGGRLSEQSLFILKNLEARSDLAGDEAAGEAALVELEGMTGRRFETQPEAFFFPRQNTPVALQIALARAEQEKSAADLALARAQRLPRLSLRASTGFGSSFGLGFDDQANSATLGVELTQPLSWGQDFGLRGAYAEFAAARARLAEETRDANTALAILTRRDTELLKAISDGAALVTRAQTRLSAFNEQFLAGVSTISEAAAIIDSYKRIRRSQIENRYELFSVQNEKTKMLGLYGPITVKAAP